MPTCGFTGPLTAADPKAADSRCWVRHIGLAIPPESCSGSRSRRLCRRTDEVWSDSPARLHQRALKQRWACETPQLV